jgi:octaprenyl-diphosphate synthase
MKEDVAKIKSFIKDDMKTFESNFKEALGTNNELLDKITNYIIKSKGKQMRPMFVIICNKIFNKPNSTTFIGASLIELLHTATLVHDDVVDDSMERRGFFSVNALWKNKIAVLVGDYLLAKGLLLSIDNGKFDILRIVSNAVKEMSEGELLQMQKARDLDINEEVYFEVIRKKTASLIGACCGVGAASADQKPEVIQEFIKLGEIIGTAFQIKDDIFDYGFGQDIGKPIGIDIKERKMTLPLIYTLNKVDKKTSKYIRNIIKHHNENSKKVKEVVNLVIENDGVKYATEKMENLKNEALQILYKYPKNEARSVLETLIYYTINRTK